MKLNILIIGKNSFLGSNLFKYLKKMNLKPKKVNLNNFLKFENSYLSSFKFIINFSTNKSYFLKDYKKKNDFDLLVANKTKDIKSKLVIFSTGKVYGPGYKLVEKSKKSPIDIYGKNKLISEKKIIKIKKNLLILRLSNIVGKSESKKRRKITHLFFDDIRKNLKKNKVIIPKKTYFKDFLLVDDFVKIVYLCILKNVSGVYNLSANIKIYLNSLANKISLLTGAKILYSNEKTYSFTLNNNKILKKLKIKKKLLNLENNLIKVIR
tara:strand:+ start:2254 stop:3051 length:798 start_codon:yes stop_codon:yes gene_type:complete